MTNSSDCTPELVARSPSRAAPCGRAAPGRSETHLQVGADPGSIAIADTEQELGIARNSDLVCLAHLRWDSALQRPQHLLTRFSRERRVFYIEEPVYGDSIRLEISPREHGLHVVTPHLPAPMAEADLHQVMRGLIDRLFEDLGIANPVLWFYTPMAVPFTNHLRPRLVVYDCMDELSGFAGAPPTTREREAHLLAWADLVFTSGQSLYEAKRARHPQVHSFPSSIDREHFAQARRIRTDPADQAGIPHCRAGFFGVVDERFDAALLDGVARAMPDWHFVIVGPVLHIDPAILPHHGNIHYLGGKDYQDLPHYLAGWDVALLPLVHDDSTRFINPTETSEYLSAGCPVVSTSITDVVRPFGELGMARIADGVAGFVEAIGDALKDSDQPRWNAKVDRHVGNRSWDSTWSAMRDLMGQAAIAKGQGLDHLVSSTLGG